jgi:hypothetical protein
MCRDSNGREGIDLRSDAYSDYGGPRDGLLTVYRRHMEEERVHGPSIFNRDGVIGQHMPEGPRAARTQERHRDDAVRRSKEGPKMCPMLADAPCVVRRPR